MDPVEIARRCMLSIVAYDEAQDRLGIGIAASSVAVGSRCPHLPADGHAALTTQGVTNPGLGRLTFDLLQRGLQPTEVLQTLEQHDRWIDYRQIGLVSSRGEAVAHTGRSTVPWSGQIIGRGFVCLGNGLADGGPLEAMARRFATKSDFSLEERLLSALESGRATACGPCGLLSAALLSGSTARRSRLDLRVDLAHRPIEAGGNALEDLDRLFRRYRPLADYYEKWTDNPLLGDWRNWDRNDLD